MRTNFGDGNNGAISDSSPQKNDPTSEATMPASPPTREKQTAPATSIVEVAMKQSTLIKKRKVQTAEELHTAETAANNALPPATDTQSLSTSADVSAAEAMTAVLRTAVLKVTWCVER